MKYLFYLMLALLLTGCRVSKKVTEQTTTVQTEENAKDSGRVDVKDISVLDTRLDELNTETEELNVTITNYSAPDSTGRQYATQTTTVKYNRRADNKKEGNSNLMQNTKLEAEGTRNTSQGERTEQREREHKEKPPERWPYVVIVAVALAIGYGVYRKLR